MKDNVLITGVAGFIGSHVADHLVEKYNVIGIDDLSGGKKENVPEGVDFKKVSVCDIKAIQEIFEEYKPKYVYHLAAYAAEGLSHFIRIFNYNNNLIGSTNLINESIKHGVECFIFTSSMATYGTNITPLEEKLKPDPEDPYGVAKYAVEMDLKAANEVFGLNYIIFRPFNVYGKRQNINDKYRNVIGIFMNQILSDRAMSVFGDGTQKRSFSYIDDIDWAIAESVEHPEMYNDVFNIGSTQEYELNELAHLMRVVVGYEHPILYAGDRYEVKNAYCSTEKIRSILNIGDTPLIEGLRCMWEWAKKQKIEKPKKFKDIEITKNLPNAWK